MYMYMYMICVYYIYIIYPMIYYNIQHLPGGSSRQADDGFVGPGGATREQLAALTAMLQQNPEMSPASAQP